MLQLLAPEVRDGGAGEPVSDVYSAGALLYFAITGKAPPLETEEFGPLECFECGCCSYSCPSNRPLVQFMQVAKAAYRHEAAKQRTHA